MDSNKPSLPSKVLQVNSREGNESPLEEMEQRRDSVHGERQRETETRESDVVDGLTTAAETNSHHKGSAEKLKFSTIGHQRRTKQKVVTDFSTLSKGGASGAKPRVALKQVLFSQGVSDKTSEERSQLDALRQELDLFAVPDSLKWRWKEESQGTTLESSWTVLVQSHSTMAKMQKHQQEALWEFVHTELNYINKLKIIQELVIAALIKLHEQGLLQEVTPKLLFSNLPSILHAHQLFWQEVVFPMLQEVRHSGKPFDPMRLEAGCLQFHERFSVYHDYCWEEEDNLEFARKQMEHNPHLFTFIQWVEAHPQCERMRLGDMQAKPHQRITKYPLLLKAILSNTQEPHVEQTLRGMLSSVNGFLGSINDYMQFRDDELALSISAQRVEGYEVEGINEEIDKHVRDICQFNLTCPIKGVGPEVIRKLLLEENLKVRGRKDSKLELVALLFSDVLLLAKVQKKGERLKVFRPPVALDRTQCIPLKDGYSFLLVEIGELQSPVNVLILVASTSDRCSTWVSTIQEAQKTLKELREQETTRLENLRVHEPVTQPKVDDMEMEEQPLMQGKDFYDELSEVLSTSRGINGLEVANNGLPFGISQHCSSDHKLLQKSTKGHLPEYKGLECSETRSQEGDENGNQWQGEDDNVVAIEQSVMLNHRVQSFPGDQDNFIQNKATDPVRYNRTKPQFVFLEGLPDVDYPTDEESTLQLHNQSQMTKEGFLKPLAERELLIRSDSDLQQDIRRGSWSSQSLDMESPIGVFNFSKDLKSPKLRRRRPVSTNLGSSTVKSEQSFQNSRKIPSVSNSSSNSDSDCNLHFKRNSLPAAFGSDSHRLLKLGSVRQRRDMFQDMHHAASVNSQIFSQSDLQEMSFQNKKPKLKTLRSSSIPNNIIEGSNGQHVHSSYLQASPQTVDTSGSGHDGEIEDKPSNSPLEGFLEKAKERERVKAGVKRDKKLKITNVRSKHLPLPTSFPPTPSPTGGDRDTEWEDVALMRHRGLSVSKGWKEQLVDGDEYDKMSGAVFVDGVNVDWPGWCVDDDEVMDRLTPVDEGLMEGISRSLADFGFNYFSEQEDGECSQV